MAGFPDRETSLAVAAAYADSGADLVELGVPFSDPLADGPTIHAAATTALEGGATLATALEVCHSIADRVPVVLMIYTNMVIAHGGPQGFAAILAASGAAGAILPDLPLGEDDEIRDALAAEGLALVPLVAPTTEPDRRREICERANGFIYLVSTTGTTGERAAVPAHLAELATATREDAGEVPVAVGFGISTPEHAGEVGKVADGVIIGSRLVRAAGEAASPQAAADAAGEFLAETRVSLGR